MGENIEMSERDPKGVNDYIKVTFKDVLAEPKDIESCDCVWISSEACFEGSRNCCYMFLSGICGLVASLYWGLQFACIAFYHVWCLTPALRVFVINCTLVQKCFGNMVACFLAPIFETCGLLFSHITVNQKQDNNNS